jgi:GT2 family glycosyltransferase
LIPETPTANGVSHRDTPFAFELRRFLLQTLNKGLSGVASPAASQPLRDAREALRAKAVHLALRHLDRAWRCLPADAPTLASVYGSLLVLEGRDYYAALGLLQRAMDLAPNPDVAALMVHSLLRLERPEDARRHFEAAVTEHSVEPGGLLFKVAGEVMLHPAIRAPGWVGRGANLDLVGEISPEEPSNVLAIKIDGGVGFSQLLPRRLNRDQPRRFSFPTPNLNLHSRLEVCIHGRPLLGSGSHVPAKFGLDGRAASTGHWVSGWARIAWAPTHRLRLRIEDECGHCEAIRTSPGFPGRGFPFGINLRAAGLRGSRIRISAQLPDGQWEPLPDSPLLLARAISSAHKSVRLPDWGSASTRVRLQRAGITPAKLIDVIIPVYRGREETLGCIASVLATLDLETRVVVVDDATDEAPLAAALDALAAEGRITLLRNKENQGFVASVNRALALHPTHDAILLNSDTLVFDDWLARLRAAAYSGPAVGTVTPLSNSGSIASYPRELGAEVSPQYAAALHTLAASTHPGMSVEIPVGVGFCLYMRRDCLSEVGELDAEVFGKGYGEEVDFCLRARRRGWSHRLAADVFVYHAGGGSFGTRRAALLERSGRLLNLRYPGYDKFIASFLKQDPLQLVRRRLDEHRLSAFQGRFVLLVTLAMSGGVERFVAERCRDLRAQGLFPLLLKPSKGGSARCELSTDAMELPNLRYDIPKDIPALSSVLRALRLDAVEIQHFLHLDARVIDAVRALPVRYDIFVHDYSWICPRVTLIDGSGRYCGEPAVTVCQTCVRRNGSNLGEKISVPALRERSEKWLRGARRVTVPSPDTAARLRRHFSDLDVRVQPHAAPAVPTLPALRDAARKMVRVALVGAIGDHKGYKVLLGCARDARLRRLPLEFVVIGYTRDDARALATGKVFVTGRYSEGEAGHLLRREQPDVVWLPSVWPETWCYTLDHALGTGLPVVSFDLGAIAERLREAKVGVLLPLGLAPRRINDRFLELVDGAHIPALEARRSVQSQLSRERNDANMRMPQFDETQMNNTSDDKTAQEALSTGMSASVQVLPLPPGLYLFSVKTASPTPARSNGELTLPAVHVGLGPGMRSDQVEFIAGPSTHGAWLFAQGDLLVTKVNGTGATLVMTSVRAPGGDVLSIKVERLESRVEAPATPRPATPDAAPLGRRQKGSSADVTTNDLFLPVQIGAHIRSRGDMLFVDALWAGRVAPGLWIESFSILPLEEFGAQEVEYKGLTGSGFETPWLSDNKMCGTKGMAVPLVGFAVRLKTTPATAGFVCEYSGYFQSGVTVGPLRNGAPCRSTVANDPLEGIQVRLIKQASAALPSDDPQNAAKGTKSAARGTQANLEPHTRSSRRQSTRRP